MRQIEVFTSNGLGADISHEIEPEKQIRRVLRVARRAFEANGNWPIAKDRQSEDWLFNVGDMVKLDKELKKLEKLL